MATQKPISTISYNTEPFLKEKLETWYKAHIIQNYMYICHKGEDGDKDHIHLRIEPNKKLDPMDLMEDLREFQLGKDKPLGCRPFRPSKEEDWILYAVHDEDYLKIKYGGGESKEKLPYKWENIVAPENYDVEVAYIRARAKLEHTSSNLLKRIQQGNVKPTDLIAEGENVYIVNAINRAVYTNDYYNVLNELNSVKAQLDALTDAVYDFGLSIECDENNNVVLKKVSKK